MALPELLMVANYTLNLGVRHGSIRHLTTFTCKLTDHIAHAHTTFVDLIDHAYSDRAR